MAPGPLATAFEVEVEGAALAAEVGLGGAGAAADDDWELAALALVVALLDELAAAVLEELLPPGGSTDTPPLDELEVDGVDAEAVL